MTTVFFFILFLYLAVLFGIALAFLDLPSEKLPVSEPHTGVSIVICMRNEAQYISDCLKSILSQNLGELPVQLILIDDNSQDESATVAESILKNTTLDYLLIRNSKRESKKASILKAVSLSKHNLLLLRDADTLSPDKNWLKCMLNFQEKGKYDLVIGPVTVVKKEGFLSGLQQIENNILQMLSAGTAALHRPFLCSGANLLFTRSSFESVNGFNSHRHIESGDDVLFLEDLKKTGKARIAYLKSKPAQVFTYPASDWKALLRQKTRWASKFRVNPNPFNTFLAVLVFVVNLLWVMSFFQLLFFFQLHFSMLLFLLLKSGADLFLLFLSRSFMPMQFSTMQLLLSTFVYPFYALAIGFRSLLVKPVWA